jgi:hypothetical protein
MSLCWQPEKLAKKTRNYDLALQSAEFGIFKLCGSWLGNHPKAAEFLGNETLQCQVVVSCFFSKLFTGTPAGGAFLAGFHMLFTNRARAA